MSLEPLEIVPVDGDVFEDLIDRYVSALHAAGYPKSLVLAALLRDIWNRLADAQREEAAAAAIEATT